MVSRGGASLVEREPVFSRDGKRLLVCTACTVTVFSVQTGEVLTVLKGHTGFVNSVVVVPNATICHCWTAALDGTVRFWDFAAGTLLRTVNVGHPVQSMVIPELCKPRDAEKGDGKRKALVAFLSVGWYKGEAKDESEEDVKGRVICYNLTSAKQIPGHLAKTRYVETLCVSPGGGLVGMADDHKAWIWMVPQGGIEKSNVIPWTILHHTKRILVLAFDSSETRVAAGDHTGRILVWENVGDRTFSSIDNDGKVRVGKFTPPPKIVMRGRVRGGGVRGKDDAASCTTYHWHAREVKSLTFTMDGVYLLSGGLEGVLVVWQMETGKRTYLPRLGGALFYIAPSLHPALFAIACMDNSIKLLNTGTMDVERTIQGIKPPFVMPKQLSMNPSMVSIEPSEGKIVVATHNLSLQFYDPASDQHVAELQVTPRNYVVGAREEEEEGLSTCVTHVAFSADGLCMATVDVRIGEQSIGGGACLKFWEKNLQNRKFSINTQIDEPHEISALSFQSRERMAVSCSDTEFKIWVPHERRASRVSWRCRSVGSYRQRPILAAAFSSDGSILAVAASEFLTLWNPATNSLVKVLSNAVVHPLQPIHHLAFVNQSNCLVAASSGERPLLTVWDVSTLSVRWSQAISVESLSVDPIRANFAVLAGVPSDTYQEGTFGFISLVAYFF
ncbi:hypothetical protein M758_3G165500 [Ceratodon purpureus]|nr:hypothetical protein M758_3G165500 [Ceratodon purpureus]